MTLMLQLAILLSTVTLKVIAQTNCFKCTYGDGITNQYYCSSPKACTTDPDFSCGSSFLYGENCMQNSSNVISDCADKLTVLPQKKTYISTLSVT